MELARVADPGLVLRARTAGSSCSTRSSGSPRYTTVRRYLQLQPWHENVSKRQVRSPMVYIGDSGILHTGPSRGDGRSETARRRIDYSDGRYGPRGGACPALEHPMRDRSGANRTGVAVAVFVACLAGAAPGAEDWPQWRGVNRDAVWNETGLVERFADEGLLVKWRTPVRGGFAGPAVAGGRVFVLDYQETPGSRTMDGHERLLALDEETGAVLWTAEWPAAYRNLQYKFATGPRATPLVDGDRVYHPRGGGDAVVLRHRDGRPRLARRHGGRVRRDGAGLRRLAVAARRG